MLEERVNNGLTAGYVYGNDLISQQRGSEKSFYLVDGLGSTRGLTDASGVVSDRYSYDAFGNLIGVAGSTENNYLFAGEQFDENLGDYYLRARYYDTDTGRFTRRDSYEGRRVEPISLHKYLYGNANPVTHTDPTGLYSVAEANAATSISNTLDSIHLESGQRFITSALGDRDPSPDSIVRDTLFSLGLLAGVPAFVGAFTFGAKYTKAVTLAVSNVTNNFDIGYCDDCAKAVKRELKRIGINGTHIRIETVTREELNGRIFSKTANDLISTNGYHEAIVVKINGSDMVFDNIHKNGIPKQQWIDDFETFVPLKPEKVLETF